MCQDDKKLQRNPLAGTRDMDQANKEALLENGDKIVTYVFGGPLEMRSKEALGWKTRIWQVFPSVCASLICIPFGIMLGWPSPSYPHMLIGWDDSSEIRITSDQSAMVAGSLMIGNDLATPFSTKSFFGAKYGMVIGASLMSAGWMVMWQALDVFWLLGSRILVGLGYGYAVGQLKIYIKEMCEDDLAANLAKQINLYGNFGMILAYAIGPFADFRKFSMIAIIVSIFVMFLIIFLPSTPRELIKSNNVKDAKRLLLFLKPNADVEEEISKIVLDMTKINNSVGFSGIVRDETLRRNFFIFCILIFCQQFSGLPATLVYCQVLFEKSHVPNSIFVALGYCVLYFISSVIGIYVMPKYNKKTVLLISSILVSLVTAVKIFVIFFEVNERLFPYASVVVMYVFVIVNTVGLGSIPVTMINQLFPKNCRHFMVLFFIMLLCLLALIITKIFQTLLFLYNLYVPFCLFFSVSVFTVGFVLIFVPKKAKDEWNCNFIHNKS